MMSPAEMSSISRHKTAIKRPDVSRPVRLVLEHGLLDNRSTFFDYGCGYGDDVNRLTEQGISAEGWDPVHRPDVERRQADIVNLGYVVNVIEHAAERAAVLRDAWSLTGKLLIVSARLSLEAHNGGPQKPYKDGCVTSRGTFQKFYEQHELRDWINDVLTVPSVAAGPGIFYVFRDQNLAQSFVASRYRRVVSPPRLRSGNVLFEQHKSLFQPLTEFITRRGRLPDEKELESAPLIRREVGSLRRAFSIIRQVTGGERWNQIRDERSQDLLVFLALSRFDKRPRFTDLPVDLQLDIRAFFATHRRACELADALLFSAGRPEVIRDACRQSTVGKKTPDALYIHASALSFLPSILRVYEGCARAYIGVVEGANVIKLHLGKPQVSYLYYPDFDTDPHPALNASLVVPLQTFHVQYREYMDSENPFILHRKETFLSPDHPLQPKFARLTRQEERYCLYESPELIGTKRGWETVLHEKGVYLSGHKLLRKEKGELNGS
jgi:DNA phosphorothioation-associated putative methyltransferase